MAKDWHEKPFDKLKKVKKKPLKFILSFDEEKLSEDKKTVSGEIIIDKTELESTVKTEIEYIRSFFDRDGNAIDGWEDKLDLGIKILDSNAFKVVVRAYYEMTNNPPAAHLKTLHLLNRLNPNFQIHASSIKEHEKMEKSGALDEAIDHLHKAAEILGCLHYPLDARDSDFDFTKLTKHLDHPPYGIDDAFLRHPLALRHRIVLQLPVDMGIEAGVATLFMYGLLGKSIERIARAVEITFKEGFFSKSTPYYTNLGYSADNVGTRGAAFDNKAATRGLFIRELNNLVPECVENRYSIIAKLAQLGGHENIDRHYVRSLLRQGHT